ncbi:MAG: hypothetical protein ACTS4U_00255 [Candidatus Hodgkinia cicadicola]
MLGGPRAYRKTWDGRAFEVVIGLEAHLKLEGDAKVFSGASDEVRPLDEGLPGSLPTVGGAPWQLMFALFGVARCFAAPSLSFTRKSYRSPDIALGYQITQCFRPIASNGTLRTVQPNSLRGERGRRVRLLRFSVEHDAANFVGGKRYVNYVRSGGSLFEVATAPDLDCAVCVRLVLVKLKLLLKVIGTRSQVRFDLNFTTAAPLGGTNPRTELKNLTCLGSLEGPFDVALKTQAALTGKAMTCALSFKARSFVGLRLKERAHEYKRIPESNLGCSKMWKSALPAVPLETGEVIAFGGASAWTFDGAARSCEMFTAGGFGRVKIAIKVAEASRWRGV